MAQGPSFLCPFLLSQHRQTALFQPDRQYLSSVSRDGGKPSRAHSEFPERHRTRPNGATSTSPSAATQSDSPDSFPQYREPIHVPPRRSRNDLQDSHLEQSPGRQRTLHINLK